MEARSLLLTPEDIRNPQASMIKAFDCIKGNTIKRGSGALIL